MNIGRPNPCGVKTQGMVAKRVQHKNPVIRALNALYGETHIGLAKAGLLVAGFLRAKKTAITVLFFCIDMKNFTIFNGRLGRKHYFFSLLLLGVIVGIITEISTGIGSVVSMFLATILIAKRFRDIDASGWFALITLFIQIYIAISVSYEYYFEASGSILCGTLLIVIINVYLLLKKGDVDENQYGKPTYSLGFINALRDTSTK